MEEFPSNSRRSERTARNEDEPKKIVPVVRGEATRRKTPLGKRMSRNILGGDVQSVWGYMFGEVLVPAARNMIADALTGGVERAIFGDNVGPGRTRSRSVSSGNRDYNGISRGSRTMYREEPRREISRRARSNHEFDEIVLETRMEAEEVLDRMESMIHKYDHVSIAEFYELCGISSNFTDNKWGWTEIHGWSISRARGGGYVINLPSPEPLD